MAFPIAPRLSEIRQAVALRARMGSQSLQSPEFVAELDEAIRAAFNEVLVDAEFLVLRVRLEIDLIDAQHSYDMPDGMAPGDIEAVYAVGTDGQEVNLHAGLQTYERTQWKEPPPDADGNVATRKGLPRRYEVINQNLDIYPAPEVERWPLLRIEGTRTPPEPVQNDDRIEVDKEALIRLSVAHLMSMRRDPTANEKRAQYEHYLAGCRADESEQEILRLGYHHSRKFPFTRRRQTDDVDRSRYPHWNPHYNG